MPSFIEGVLLVLMIFGFCVGLAVIIKLTTIYIEEKYAPKPDLQKQEPKVYLVKQTTSPEQKPKRKRRSPKIAFEGLVLKPEKVTFDEGTNVICKK